MTITIYGDSISGNCLKVKWTADRLSIPYEWIEVDVVKGETQRDEFRRLNPAAQVPTVMSRSRSTPVRWTSSVLAPVAMLVRPRRARSARIGRPCPTLNSFRSRPGVVGGLRSRWMSQAVDFGQVGT